jgi:hypothetical protein
MIEKIKTDLLTNKSNPISKRGRIVFETNVKQYIFLIRNFALNGNTIKFILKK